MATAITAGNLIQVRLNFTSGDGVGMNVLYYRVDSTVGASPAMATIMAAIASALFTKMGDAWSPCASVEAALASVTVQDVFPLPRSLAYTYVPGSTNSGDVESGMLPAQDAPTLLKKTDYGQRWGLGRVFVYGFADELATGGFVNAGGLAPLAGFAAALDDVVTVTNAGFTVTMSPVIISGPTDNPTRTTTVREVSLSNTTIKTQRRRRPGKGM